MFATAVTNIAFAQTNRPAASKADYTVALRFGKQTALTQEDVQTLYAKALELLETSNFNSRAGVWHGGSIAQLQEHWTVPFQVTPQELEIMWNGKATLYFKVAQ